MIKTSATVSLVPHLRGGPWIYWDGLEDSCAKAAAAGFDAIELFALKQEDIKFKTEKESFIGGVNEDIQKVLQRIMKRDMRFMAIDLDKFSHFSQSSTTLLQCCNILDSRADSPYTCQDVANHSSRRCRSCTYRLNTTALKYYPHW